MPWKKKKPAPPPKKHPPCDYKPVGTVTKDGKTWTIWKCTMCPKRMETE